MKGIQNTFIVGKEEAYTNKEINSGKKSRNIYVIFSCWLYLIPGKGG